VTHQKKKDTSKHVTVHRGVETHTISLQIRTSFTHQRPCGKSYQLYELIIWTLGAIYIRSYFQDVTKIYSVSTTCHFLLPSMEPAALPSQRCQYSSPFLVQSSPILSRDALVHQANHHHSTSSVYTNPFSISTTAYTIPAFLLLHRNQIPDIPYFSYDRSSD
jgi:hypothetical protein